MKKSFTSDSKFVNICTDMYRGKTGQLASEVKVVIWVFPMYREMAKQKLDETVVTYAVNIVCDFEAEDSFFELWTHE